ncbi:MAG TPA: hypothetical protein VEN28_14115 [Burkholderiaceae bacterium]|nr:hypothetical protein [Burkholderiaceae bacterium]
MTEFKNPPAGPTPDMDGTCHPLLSLEPLDPRAEAADTWITIGDQFDDGTTEERTVTVVFRRDLDDPGTDDALLRPFEPTFPGHR